MPLPEMVKLDEVLTAVLEPLNLTLKAILETDTTRVTVLELPGGGERAQITVIEKHAPVFSRRPIEPHEVERMSVEFPKTPLGTVLAAQVARGYFTLIHGDRN